MAGYDGTDWLGVSAANEESSLPPPQGQVFVQSEPSGLSGTGTTPHRCNATCKFNKCLRLSGLARRATVEPMHGESMGDLRAWESVADHGGAMESIGERNRA
ncbi:hypothetical protein E4U28_008342 [Claviceps purpurea]|nr:hypothetical protein E4U28_008342 [Claviceps purpurea]